VSETLLLLLVVVTLIAVFVFVMLFFHDTSNILCTHINVRGKWIPVPEDVAKRYIELEKMEKMRDFMIIRSYRSDQAPK